MSGDNDVVFCCGCAYLAEFETCCEHGTTFCAHEYFTTAQADTGATV
jgi:hypothetical protein